MYYAMIQSFAHKGLREFWETGSTVGIQSDQAKRIRVRLTSMNAASEIADLNLPGWSLHELKGDREGIWSLKVNASWRITFQFVEGECVEVDLEQYH
jgi:proteic killer suppression protein